MFMLVISSFSLYASLPASEEEREVVLLVSDRTQKLELDNSEGFSILQFSEQDLSRESSAGRSQENYILIFQESSYSKF